jgi:hypothetical protein
MSAARTLIRDQTGVARERSDGHHVLHRGPAFGAGRRSIFSTGSFDGHRHAHTLSLGLFITPHLKPTLIRCPGSLCCRVFSAALRSAQAIKHRIARAVVGKPAASRPRSPPHQSWHLSGSARLAPERSPTDGRVGSDVCGYCHARANASLTRGGHVLPPWGRAPRFAPINRIREAIWERKI